MIRAVQIARFRGIRECVADGLGRVNLIIGKNDCGKTAFMEALQVAEHAESAAPYLLGRQRTRLGRAAKPLDFARFWRPIFYGLDAKTGLSIGVSRDDGAWQTLEARQVVVADEVVIDHGDALRGGSDPYGVEDVRSPTWALDLQVTTYDRVATHQRVLGAASKLTLPSSSNGIGSAWIHSGAAINDFDIRYVSEMKQRGQDMTLVELLREVDGRVTNIEILAPGGDTAELFVRLDNGTPMLPALLMGEGFQRCLDLGATAAAHDWPTMFIDEIENGMHHLVLEPLWRWIAVTARRRNLQVFATTHSEECIHAASRAFHSLDDDGLRVIRLDRIDGSTRATIYDRSLVETAERTGTEIRG